jgi:hypothetical protein
MVKTILADYHQQRVTLHQLMRVLGGHASWLVEPQHVGLRPQSVPAERLMTWGQSTTTQTVELATYIFTDHEAAAAGVVERQYITNVHGAELFSKLRAPGGVVVNPFSPIDQQLRIAAEDVEMVQAWGNALLLEAALDGPLNDAVIDQIADFATWIYLTENRKILASESNAGRLAPLFTTPDCLAAYLATQGLDSLGQVIISGRDLFARYPDMNITGFRVNPAGPRYGGPGVAVWSREACVEIMEGIANRSALAELEDGVAEMLAGS